MEPIMEFFRNHSWAGPILSAGSLLASVAAVNPWLQFFLLLLGVIGSGFAAYVKYHEACEKRRKHNAGLRRLKSIRNHKTNL